MIYPVENIVITGEYNDSHQALDLGWTNTPNEKLLACSDGYVEDIYYIEDGGKTILINYDNSYQSYFMHCSKIIVKKGDRVVKKQVVAYMGDTGYVTGPHCHFILKLNGNRVDPRIHCYVEEWQTVDIDNKDEVMYKTKFNYKIIIKYIYEFIKKIIKK